MKVKFFCPRWGSEQIPWNSFLEEVKAARYAGVEWFPGGESTPPAEVLPLFQQYGLEFSIVMAVLNAPGSFEGYISALKEQLTTFCGYKPLFVTAQTGREYFTAEQITACIDTCKQVSQQTQVPVYQETHRNKWSYAAHVVGPFLQQHPDLPLTLDVSHWFCVSESYLEDQQDTVESAIRHARHIHARVGHTEGPQVWDPAAPEYAEALQAHLAIWDKWVAQRSAAGAGESTITPEFGPPPYLVFGNRQGSPREEQWRLNLWMKDLLDKRYNI